MNTSEGNESQMPNGDFELEDAVYFTLVVDETPHTVKYRVVEKIETLTQTLYTIEALAHQEDPEVPALLEQQKISPNFRMDGASLSATREAAIGKARRYFENLIRQLSPATEGTA